MILLLQGILYCTEEGVVTKKTLRKWKASPLQCYKISLCFNLLSEALEGVYDGIVSYCQAYMQGTTFKTKYTPKGVPLPLFNRAMPPQEATFFATNWSLGDSFELCAPMYQSQSEAARSNTDTPKATKLSFKNIGWLMQKADPRCPTHTIQKYIELFESLVEIFFSSWVMVQSCVKDDDNIFDICFYALGLKSKYWTRKKIRDNENLLRRYNKTNIPELP